MDYGPSINVRLGRLFCANVNHSSYARLTNSSNTKLSARIRTRTCHERARIRSGCTEHSMIFDKRNTLVWQNRILACARHPLVRSIGRSVAGLSICLGTASHWCSTTAVLIRSTCGVVISKVQQTICASIHRTCSYTPFLDSSRWFARSRVLWLSLPLQAVRMQPVYQMCPTNCLLALESLSIQLCSKHLTKSKRYCSSLTMLTLLAMDSVLLLYVALLYVPPLECLQGMLQVKYAYIQHTWTLVVAVVVG